MHGGQRTCLAKRAWKMCRQLLRFLDAFCRVPAPLEFWHKCAAEPMEMDIWLQWSCIHDTWYSRWRYGDFATEWSEGTGECYRAHKRQLRRMRRTFQPASRRVRQMKFKKS